MVQVRYGEYAKLYVVEGNKPNWLGHACMKTMRLDWLFLKEDSVSECSPISLKAVVLQEYGDVFSS